MKKPLRTTVTLLLFVLCLYSKSGLGQTIIQYDIADHEYNYTIVLENVTDHDECKLPLAILHELSGIMPAFDSETHEIKFHTRKNLSKLSIREILEERDYTILVISKKESNTIEESKE